MTYLTKYEMNLTQCHINDIYENERFTSVAYNLYGIGEIFELRYDG